MSTAVAAPPISKLLSDAVAARSRSAVAIELGVSSQAIAYWVAGQRIPKYEYSDRLAQVLGIPAAEVMESITAQRSVGAPPLPPIARPSSSIEERLAAVEAELAEGRATKARLDRLADELESMVRARKPPKHAGRVTAKQ